MTRKHLLAATLLAPFVAVGSGAYAQPVNGLYIGAGGGANFLQRETFSKFGGTYAGFQTGYVGLGSIGYGFGNGLRVELEGSYRHNKFGRPTPLGGRGGYEDKYGPMANVLFDLDIGSPYIFPYIGGGLGYSQVDQRQSAVLPGFGIGGGAVTPTSLRLNGSSGSFAYQAIAGLSFPIPGLVGLSATAEYRFFALAGNRSFKVNQTGGLFPGSFSTGTTDNYNHSLLLGLRYAFNVAPPAVLAPAAAPAPRAEAARTFLVFFDWDRADLTDRARLIIAEAAQATTRTQVTRIEVAGHTDTSGTAQYNQGLSVRRAQNVASELVRLGVPRASIATQGFGFSRPLVATGPGVREPQNRRVEIVLR